MKKKTRRFSIALVLPATFVNVRVVSEVVPMLGHISAAAPLGPREDEDPVEHLQIEQGAALLLLFLLLLFIIINHIVVGL